MYIIPFWSYRPAGDSCVMKNWLTGEEFAADRGFPRALERIFAAEAEQAARGPAGAGESGDLALARRLAFADRASAADYLGSMSAYRTAPKALIEQIEMTNRCPYTCPMCPRTTSMTRDLGDMPLDLFRKIINQVSDRQRYVALHHFGESLLHRQLPAAVAYARDMRIRTGLSCNAPSLRPDLAGRLLKAGLANILLSQDSLDPDVYRSIRGRSARMSLADTHIRELVAQRNQGGHDTSVTLQMISMNANKAEAARFLEYCMEVGVDRGIVIRLGRWDFDDEYVSQLGELGAPGYTAPCALPWRSVVVMWDGRVVPCCHDYDGMRVLGDLGTDPLDQIWDAAVAREFRDRNDEAELCQRCAFSFWYRERQRENEGFLNFHRERVSEERREWINPDSAGWRDGLAWYDMYDIVNSANSSAGV